MGATDSTILKRPKRGFWVIIITRVYVGRVSSVTLIYNQAAKNGEERVHKIALIA